MRVITRLSHAFIQENLGFSKQNPKYIQNPKESRPKLHYSFLKTAKAKLNLCELPPGDVLSTFANTDSFFNWVGYKAVTSIEDGMAEFIKWYLDYYNA